MIELQNVTKIYSNGAVGLNNINLKIKQGEFIFLTGSSGSGKSSLLKLLYKEIEPDKGRIIINDKDITTLKKKQIPYLRREMGMVFQDFRLLPNKTVYENVSFAMEILGASAKNIRRNVPTVLGWVGLSKKSRCYPHELSGGEQQRTALARAIVNYNPILIADEPTGNLDPTTSWDVMNCLQEINAHGITVIMATHEREIVNTMQKRVVELNNGQISKDVREGGYDDEMDYSALFV